MDSVDANVKKAYAQNYLLGNRLMDVIDRQFEAANAYAYSKQASDEDAQLAYAIKCAAEAQKEQHVAQVMQLLGCSAKVANDLLNQVAEEDPEAVMPAESMDEADADEILAQAAQEDADAAQDEADAEAEEGDGEVDEEALAEEIQGVMDQLTE